AESPAVLIRRHGQEVVRPFPVPVRDVGSLVELKVGLELVPAGTEIVARVVVEELHGRHDMSVRVNDAVAVFHGCRRPSRAGSEDLGRAEARRHATAPSSWWTAPMSSMANSVSSLGFQFAGGLVKEAAGRLDNSVYPIHPGRAWNIHEVGGARM